MTVAALARCIAAASVAASAVAAIPAGHDPITHAESVELLHLRAPAVGPRCSV